MLRDPRKHVETVVRLFAIVNQPHARVVLSNTFVKIGEAITELAPVVCTKNRGGALGKSKVSLYCTPHKIHVIMSVTLTRNLAT